MHPTSTAPILRIHRKVHCQVLRSRLPVSSVPGSSHPSQPPAVSSADASDPATPGSPSGECNWDESWHAATGAPATIRPCHRSCAPCALVLLAEWPLILSPHPLVRLR